MKVIVYTLSLIFFNTSFLLGHGGRTNSEGCHTNHKTGEYHCHGKKKKSKPAYSNNTRSSSGYTCDKTYCKYMSSCEEAMYKFKVCGHSRLDGDNDGIPCENVCARY